MVLVFCRSSIYHPAAKDVSCICKYIVKQEVQSADLWSALSTMGAAGCCSATTGKGLKKHSAEGRFRRIRVVLLAEDKDKGGNKIR
jgi:hypothetical protein